MQDKEFSFLEFCSRLEKQMLAFQEFSAENLTHPGILGNAREHFIAKVLKQLLPRNVIVGTGEISDGRQRTRQQDIIIYRSDFPVIMVGDETSVYLIEGVIATIEVKSDLKSDDIKAAVRNQAEVLYMFHQLEIIEIEVTPEGRKEVIDRYRPRTFVVGYKGYAKEETLLEHVGLAGVPPEYLPDIIWQPNIAVVRGSSTLPYVDDQGNPVPEDASTVSVATGDGLYALLFQTILKHVMAVTDALTLRSRSGCTEIRHTLDQHFSIPKIAARPVRFVSHSKT